MPEAQSSSVGANSTKPAQAAKKFKVHMPPMPPKTAKTTTESTGPKGSELKTLEIRIKDGWRKYKRSKEENARLACDMGGWLAEAREYCLHHNIRWGKWVEVNTGLSQSQEWRFRKVYSRRSELFDANNNPRDEVFIILHGREPHEQDGDDTGGEDMGGEEGTSNDGQNGGTKPGSGNGGGGAASLKPVRLLFNQKQRKRWDENLSLAKKHFQTKDASKAALRMAEDWAKRIGTDA